MVPVSLVRRRMSCINATGTEAWPGVVDGDQDAIRQDRRPANGGLAGRSPESINQGWVFWLCDGSGDEE
jgi:hypothetical protein